MNQKINVEYATDQAVSYLHTNAAFIQDKIDNNIYDSSWLEELLSEPPFVPLKYKIDDFDLKLDVNGNYNNVLVENAIILYEHLKNIPRRILTDERFWLWISLKKCYRASIQSSMGSHFEGQWIFTRGLPRSIWYNVHSRSFFWVECTINENTDGDKYEFTRFALEKIERIRNLTFDTNKPRNIIYNTIRAEKQLYDNYANNPEYSDAYRKCESENIYEMIRKEISLHGSVRVLSAMSDDDIFKFVYDKLESILLKIKNGQDIIISG